MDIIIDIILKAGRSAVELSLFVLLPVMVVMLSLMRLLEAQRHARSLRRPSGAAAAPLRPEWPGHFCRLADQFRQFCRADGDADHDGTARHL
jgi:hypothetical protein